MNFRSSNKNGAAMLWAVLSVLLISLITAGIVFISRIYYMREQDENLKMQAELYGQSAIEIIANDIVTPPSGQDFSRFVTADNSTDVFDVNLPDATNWTCKVTVNHSLVNTSDSGIAEEEKEKNAKNSGIIYLTAKVSRNGKSGKTIELAEVCAKLTFSKANDKWEFAGYYNL